MTTEIYYTYGGDFLVTAFFDAQHFAQTFFLLCKLDTEFVFF